MHRAESSIRIEIMEVEGKDADGLVELLKDRSLPTAVRGYDREATDRLVSELKSGLQEAVRRGEANRARADELERRIAENQEREEAVTEALVVASQIRTASEREGQDLKAQYAREGEAIEEGARQRAEEIVRDAEIEAGRMVDDARQKVREFEQDIRSAEQLAVQARARVSAFLESLLAEVEQDGERDSAVDDLFVEASHAARNDDGSFPAPFDNR